MLLYKEKYKKYEDVNIVEFKDEIELLYRCVNDYIDEYGCVDIIGSDELIRELLTDLSFNYDYAVKSATLYPDISLYCLEIFDDHSFAVFDACNKKYGNVILMYQKDCIDEHIVDYSKEYDVSYVFGFEDENDDFVHGDVSDLDL